MKPREATLTMFSPTHSLPAAEVVAIVRENARILSAYE